MAATFTCLWSALVLLGISTLSSSSTLQARKAENLIRCEGSVPRDIDLWPLNRAPWYFFDSKQEAQLLCAAFENDSINAGCYCVTPIGPPVCLRSKTKAPELRDAFQAFCKDHCSCPISMSRPLVYHEEEADGGEETEEGLEQYYESYYESSMEEAEGLPGQEEQQSISKGPQYTNLLLADAMAAALRHRRPKHHRLIGSAGKCQGKCSNSYSSCGSDPSCRCKANPTNGFGVGNTALYLSTCIPAEVNTGGKVKRQIVNLPCPCNTSYVSQACCGSQQGLVWESPELMMGILITDTVKD
jgi:hypothetical protein